MRQVILITVGVLATVAFIIVGLTRNYTGKEELALTSRLQSRTQVIADSLAESIEPSYSKRATSSVQNIVDRIAGNERVIGLAVFDNKGLPIVVSNDLPNEVILSPLVEKVMSGNEAEGAFVRGDGQKMYVFVDPMHEDGHVVGALLVVQNAQYIDDAIGNIWYDNLVRFLLVSILFLAAI